MVMGKKGLKKQVVDGAKILTNNQKALTVPYQCVLFRLRGLN